MRKFMSKAFALTMVAALAVGMTACSVSVDKTTTSNETATTEAAAGMANPVIDSNETEVIEQTGIDLPAPEDAKDVSYQLINQGDDQPMIAQMNFTLDGRQYYLRACSTELTSLSDLEEDSDASDVSNVDMNAGNISGLNYDWNASGLQDLGDCEAIIQTSKEGAGYMAWLDVVPGVLYNLCEESNATFDDLYDTAEKVFVPLQGDSDATSDPADAPADFTSLLETIYNTKAGSAGSEERVQAAAQDLIAFIHNYGEDYTEQDIEELTDENFVNMEEKYGENFKADFKESFDAVCEAVLVAEPDLETDTAYLTIVNGVLIVTAAE